VKIDVLVEERGRLTEEIAAKDRLVAGLTEQRNTTRQARAAEPKQAEPSATPEPHRIPIPEQPAPRRSPLRLTSGNRRPPTWLFDPRNNRTHHSFSPSRQTRHRCDRPWGPFQGRDPLILISFAASGRLFRLIQLCDVPVGSAPAAKAP